MNRPSTIPPAAWQRMSWHQRQKATHRHMLATRARMASLEAERPKPRPSEVDPWWQAWRDWQEGIQPTPSHVRHALRLAIALLDQLPLDTYDARACEDCGADVGRRSTRCADCHRARLAAGRIGKRHNDCPDCGRPISLNARRCRPCAAVNQHRNRKDAAA